MVAATVSRAFASSLGIMAACLMAGLLGVIAVSGRWPVDAPRTHVEAVGILPLSPERVSRVEFSSGEQRAVFSRDSREEWLFNNAPTGVAIAGHINDTPSGVPQPGIEPENPHFSPDSMSFPRKRESSVSSTPPAALDPASAGVT